MARAGRKRKQGKREANGRLSRQGEVRFDTGTARAKLKFEQYGTDGADAIGRAYQAGLLGENGDAIRDTARKVFRAYWPMLEIGGYRCTLSNPTGGSNDNHDDPARIKAREEWLTSILRRVDRMGHTTRRAFDTLVIDVHPDQGPKWLDSLIWHRKHHKPYPASDEAWLNLAVDAINEIMA
ncbi:hypothetical protein K7W03_22370 [Sphingobium sp. PNB]|uniref:hypothetical protein n=1 Tax=Sphingobium sp. PNB TaxID=863934 RepID=UPI001CA3DEA2|nr:hypothetical protein [Sphingobium sp. PNB]MCB4862340.1 hypothetical protein [Sphingobium sp. PNB]